MYFHTYDLLSCFLYRRICKGLVTQDRSPLSKSNTDNLTVTTNNSSKQNTVRKKHSQFIRFNIANICMSILIVKDMKEISYSEPCKIFFD